MTEQLIPLEDARRRQSETAPLILDPRDPLRTARMFIEARFMVDTYPTLHHHRGSFYQWNGTAYAEITDDDVRTMLWELLEVALVSAKEELRPFQPTPAKVSNVYDALKAAAHLSQDYETPCWLELTPDLPPEEILPCANGLLHLPERKLLPASPLFFCHHALDYPYDPHVPEPHEWLRFLNQLWADDPSSITVLQEVIGYFLTPDTSQQKLFMLVGPKRSGKGTIGRVLRASLGKDNVCAPTLASLGTNFGSAPLIGKLGAIISDARLGTRTDQHVVAERLLSISGEDAITIDRKYREPWTGNITARFLIMTNELPRISDASGALASRFIILLLKESFYGREDHGLTKRLLQELPGLLNWSIDGWDRLRRRGYFLPTTSSEAAIDQLEDLSSPVTAFLRDCCKLVAAEEADAQDIYSAWRSWCDENGHRPGSQQTFGRNLHAAVPGLSVHQPRDHTGRRRRRYRGIGMA